MIYTKNTEYAGFRLSDSKVMKGSKAIGEIHGDTFFQQKFYPKFFLRRDRGFGVSYGLLQLLKDSHVSTFRIEVIEVKGESKATLVNVSKKVTELLQAKKIQYAGYDEQRLFNWEPKRMGASNVQKRRS